LQAKAEACFEKLFHPEKSEDDVAKGQMRSNREKKKPKADKNKKKAAGPAPSPFASKFGGNPGQSGGKKFS
jgi:hypothetical protein